MPERFKRALRRYRTVSHCFRRGVFAVFELDMEHQPVLRDQDFSVECGLRFLTKHPWIRIVAASRVQSGLVLSSVAKKE